MFPERQTLKEVRRRRAAQIKSQHLQQHSQLPKCQDILGGRNSSYKITEAKNLRITEMEMGEESERQDRRKEGNKRKNRKNEKGKPFLSLNNKLAAFCLTVA